MNNKILINFNFINKLIYILNKCWSKKTCFPDFQNLWNENNKSLGQCAVTSLIVNDYFGGEIYKSEINNISHYYNIINDEIIDLTKDQFNCEVNYDIRKIKTREEILSNKNTLSRYKILKRKVDDYYKRIKPLL